MHCGRELQEEALLPVQELAWQKTQTLRRDHRSALRKLLAVQAGWVLALLGLFWQG